jgi:hypothetical protein
MALYDASLLYDYTEAADPLVQLLDHVAARVAAVVGHARVYNRHRHTRSRAEFETLFTDTNGLEFWTVRRTTTRGQRIGNQGAVERVHTILVEGHVAHRDDAVAANSTEYQMQEHAEAICDDLRPQVTMGGLAERSWLGNTTVDDVEFAGVACHRAQVGLQAQVFATD